MAYNTSIRGRQIKDAFFGAGLIRNSGSDDIMEVNVDDSSLEINTDALRVKALGITNEMLAGSIADTKLVEDYVKTSEVDGTTIEFAGSTLNVKDDGITKEKINSDVAGVGILQNVDGSLELNVDDSSIEIASGEVLQVKASGITNDMLAGSIAFSKMVDLTANRALVSDASGDVSVSAITDTELGYLDGATSNIQGQIDALSTGYNRRKAVISIVDNTAVPPTEVSGDRYILDDVSGGVHADWDGASANDIVEFNGTSWVATTPSEGWVAYVDSQDVDALFIDDGTPQWELRNVQAQALASGDIWVGNGSNVATAQTMSGDATIDNTGALTIGADKVDNTKLANMTRGTVKVGGVADAPTDLNAKTDGSILIGDGTDVNSVAVSGDITITNAGVTAIGTDKVTKEMINSDVAGTGILQNVDGSLELNVDDSSIEIGSGEVLRVKALGITNDMLAGSIADTKLAEDYIKTSEVDGSTIEFNGGTLNVKALGITNSEIANDTIGEVKLDIHNAPTTGYVLGYTSNGLEWVAGTTSGVSESDIQVENESANCNGANTTFTLTSTPITNSVQVFLNGLLQEEGSGKDYTLSGTTVEFVEAPLTDDILLVHYIIDN
jgi:hypothetical protein